MENACENWMWQLGFTENISQVSVAHLLLLIVVNGKKEKEKMHFLIWTNFLRNTFFCNKNFWWHFPAAKENRGVNPIKVNPVKNVLLDWRIKLLITNKIGHCMIAWLQYVLATNTQNKPKRKKLKDIGLTHRTLFANNGFFNLRWLG